MLKEKTTIRFTSEAWAKLEYLRDKGNTEIGGWGISSEDDMLLVEDFFMVDQECTATYVEFDDDDTNRFMVEMAEQDIDPNRCLRIWIHTHPGNSAAPSGTDEGTFKELFDTMSWGVMFILAKGGATYARLKTTCDGISHISEIPVEVQKEKPTVKEWDDEYNDHWSRRTHQTTGYYGKSTSVTVQKFKDLLKSTNGKGARTWCTLTELNENYGQEAERIGSSWTNITVMRCSMYETGQTVQSLREYGTILNNIYSDVKNPYIEPYYCEEQGRWVYVYTTTGQCVCAEDMPEGQATEFMDWMFDNCDLKKKDNLAIWNILKERSGWQEIADEVEAEQENFVLVPDEVAEPTSNTDPYDYDSYGYAY